LPREEGGIALVSVQAAVHALQAKVACRYLAGGNKSWHVYWDYWWGIIPSAQPREMDVLRYGKRLLCMPFKLEGTSASHCIPQRVRDHVKALRLCGLERTELPANVCEVAAEPVFYNLSTNPSSLAGFLTPAKFPHLARADVRVLADLLGLSKTSSVLQEPLRREVDAALACIPESWQEMLTSRPVFPAAFSESLHHFCVGGAPFADTTVRALTFSCLHSIVAKRHPNSPLPFRPSLWPSHESSQQLSALEQSWVVVCERGLRGTTRRWEQMSQTELFRHYPAMELGREKRPRPAPSERNSVVTTSEGPGLSQQPRGPISDSGPQTAINKSWWCRLGVSHIHEVQPSSVAWGGCWQSLWGQGLTREAIWVLWRLAHGALPCGARQRWLWILDKRDEIPDGYCCQPECGNVWDTLTHAFLECPRVKVVWQWVAQLWVASSSRSSAPPLSADVILCGRTAPVWRPQWCLWHVLRAITISCIFKARERAFASGQPLSPTRVACCIVIALRERLRSDFLAASRCPAVRALYGTPAASPDGLKARFEKRWRPGGVLCSVADENVLHIHLTPHHPIPVPRYS
jgi:hypothetical protein